MENLVYFVMFVIIGLCSSYSDIRYSKIKNNLVIAGIFFTAISIIYLLLWKYASLRFLSFMIVNASLIILLAFIIWYLGFWAAGDSKLFILFSFFVLLKVDPFQKMLPLYPIVVFLTNVFALLFIYLLAVFLIRAVGFIRNKLQKSGSRGFYEAFLFSFGNIFKYMNKKKNQYLKFVWCYITLLILIQLVMYDANFRYLKSSSSVSLVSYLMPLLLFRTFNKILATRTTILVFISFVTAVLLISFLLVYGSAVIFSFIVYVRNVTYFFALFYSLKRLLSLRNDVIEEVSVDNLPDKSQLTEESILKFGFKGIGTLYPDGLTKDQVNEIKKIVTKKSLPIKIEIYKTLPLAPFIFLGAVITVLVKFPIINLLLYGKISHAYF
ncbi:MAG: hypothetical protein AB1530_00495 [Candidatus Omnitrophota bacterium]